MATGADLSGAFIPISVSTLVPSAVTGMSLFLRESSGQHKLFRDRDFPLQEDDVQKLRARGTHKVYVKADDKERLQTYLRENLDNLLQDESRPVEARFGTLNDVVRDILGESFASGNVNETIANSQMLGQRTVEVICRSDAVASSLNAVLCHDYHTFTHSANVSYYCVMLAKALGIRSQDELQAIASGGMLHDIGKLEVSDRILTKPGKLSDEEFAVIKRHPTAGLLALRGRSDLTVGQLMMAYQHHEHMDGRGYPVGATEPDIHEWARICAVVDIYEALTSDRPYRRGMTPDAAFEIMDRNALHAETYRCWKLTIRQS